MQNRNSKGRREKGGWILFHALPYAFFISSFTVGGLFGGFALGKELGGSSAAGFAFALPLCFLGFFVGLFFSCFLLKVRIF